MNSTKVELKVVKENRNNPRKISSSKLFTLVRSILTLPKMLELRPLVVDDKYTIIGGNMRYKALNIISQMSAEEIEKEIFSIVYDQKTNAEKHSLVEYWKNWKANPVVAIVKADELSPEEKKQFIFKDNLNYGEWDEDLLQGFDKFLLGEMGVMEWEEDAQQPMTEEKQELIERQPEPKERKRIIVIYSPDEIEKMKDVFGFAPDRQMYQIEELFNLKK
jgi:hypothetical protein